MKPIVNLIYELSNLDRVPRTGLYQMLYEDFESIATHSYKVAVIAYLMAKELDANVEKVLLMALFHDMAETRVGDSNWLQKKFLIQHEEKALEAQLEGVSKNTSSEIKNSVDEYKQRESLESRIVKDADNIEYYLSLKILDLKGNKEAALRLANGKDRDYSELLTDFGKQLLKEIVEADPNDWTRRDLKSTVNSKIVK